MALRMRGVHRGFNMVKFYKREMFIITCGKCGALFAIEDYEHKIPTTCPHCKEYWDGISVKKGYGLTQTEVKFSSEVTKE
jgi:hypothetical protein